MPSGGGDPLKEYLDETKDASYLFCGKSYYTEDTTTWGKNLTYERLQKILSYDTTSNVTNMNGTFFYCTNLTTIPIMNTSNVTLMRYTFQNCTNLSSIKLNTIKVTDMRYMCFNCYKLTTIDITYMNISYVPDSMTFAYNCYSLTKLIIRNMNTIPTLDSSAFNNCYHFTGTTNATYNPQGLKDGRIYVPDDKVNALKTASEWSTYADIIVPLSTLVE